MAYKVFTNGSVLNASEINENLMNQSVITFSNSTARSSAITSPVEGMLTYLEDTDTYESWDGAAWGPLTGAGYQYVQTLYLTSSGTFTKADYPWLRAISVEVLGAGGGGAGGNTTTSGQVSTGGPGGGGGYAKSFVLASALAASESYTIGAGGAAGIAGAAGSTGGTTSFGSFAEAEGGGGGGAMTAASVPVAGGVPGLVGGGTIGDFVSFGSSVIRAIHNSATISIFRISGGGNLLFPTQNSGLNSSGSSSTPSGYGRGGGNGGNGQSQATARDGAEGASGLIIIELYA